MDRLYLLSTILSELSRLSQYVHKVLLLVVVGFDSLRPINNLSVIKGRVFLGWTSTKLGLMFLLKDTTQWRRWGLNPRPLGLELSTLPLGPCAPSRKFCKRGSDSDVFFSWWKEGGSRIPLTKKSGPLSAHQRNAIKWRFAGVPMMPPNIEYWLVSFVIFQGIWTSIAKETLYFGDFQGKGRSGPPAPSVSAHELAHEAAFRWRTDFCPLSDIYWYRCSVHKWSHTYSRKGGAWHLTYQIFLC